MTSGGISVLSSGLVTALLGTFLPGLAVESGLRASDHMEGTKAWESAAATAVGLVLCRGVPGLTWPDPIIKRKGFTRRLHPGPERCGGFGAKVGATPHRNDPPRMAGRFDHRIYLWRSSKGKYR